MPDKRIVMNTTPILTLIAACGSLDFLQNMYTEVIIPLEVRDEIRQGGKYGYGVKEFENSSFIKISSSYMNIPTILSDFLDLGESSVIATALESKIPLVCIDETEGRRWARIFKLNLTGSLGILLTARKQKMDIPPIKELIPKILDRGIWIGERVIKQALAEDIYGSIPDFPEREELPFEVRERFKD
jgi:predicted nucleic acid-binding protein